MPLNELRISVEEFESLGFRRLAIGDRYEGQHFLHNGTKAFVSPMHHTDYMIQRHTYHVGNVTSYQLREE